MNFPLRYIILLAFILVSNACSQKPVAVYYDRIKQPKIVSILSGYPRVYDGDSIFFGKTEVRLTGIDAPEHDQACRDGSNHFWPCGIAARDELIARIQGREVTCYITGHDKYRRALGRCVADNDDLNGYMVASGNAIAYHYFSEAYAAQERKAKAARKGIWQDADFTEPYYCRHMEAGHTCYRYDFIRQTGVVARRALT